MERVRKFSSKVRRILEVRDFKQLLKPYRPDPKSTATIHVIPAQNIAHPESSVTVPVPKDNQPELACDNAPLENFPAEIRHRLLSKLDLDGLKALVSASPVYLQQYLLDHGYLPCECLEITLGSATIIDACAVYQSGSVEFSKTWTPRSVTLFLRSYNDRHSLSHLSLKDTFAMDEIMSMVSFHISIIMLLSRRYTGWVLGNLAKETKKNHCRDGPLSRIEETRLIRALYRFQLYCNLFGVGYRSPRGGVVIGGTMMKIEASSRYS